LATKWTRQSVPAALLVASLGAVAAFAHGGFGGKDDEEREDRDSYATGLWGDLLYSDVQAQVGVPNLIADMR
jgi:hypothetical protein